MSQSWRTDKRTSAQRGYGSRWQKARETYLRANPLCVMCQQQNKLTPATVVDHKIPHKGDQALFWSQDNWAAICATHHSSTKQRDERSGRVSGADEAGRPLDPMHPWNAKR